MAVTDYSTTPASNTTISGIGIQGSDLPSNFDGAVRQMMADIATFVANGEFTTTLTMGDTGVDAVVKHAVDDRYSVFSGGNTEDKGGNLEVYGSTHATLAGDFALKSNANWIQWYSRSLDKITWYNLSAVETASLNTSGDLYLAGDIELGHASDTTLARSAAGQVEIEGNLVATHATLNKATQVLTSGTTYTPDAAVVYFDVIAIGGGGGGGGCDGQGAGTNAGGGGGSAGATAITYGVTPSGSYTYAIGAAGTGGAAGTNSGAAGGDTTISGSGLSLMTAGGGTGGVGRTGTSGSSRPTWLPGGTATGGEINVDGDYGMIAFIRGGDVYSFPYGGKSTHGIGGRADINTSGTDGSGYGAGGGGGMQEDASTNRAGGAGTTGAIIIIEYRNE